MTNLMLKLHTMFSSGLGARLGSAVAASGDLLETVNMADVQGSMFLFLLDGVINFVLRVVYFVCRFVLNIIEFLQFVISYLLGINTKIEDFTLIDRSNPLIKLLTNTYVLNTFRIMVGVALVLIIVFTIFAIIKSEWNIAQTQDVEASSKGRIFGRTLRSIFILGFFPLVLLVSVLMINAILAGFNDILRGGQNTTIAGQIFITSAYSGNNYRNYADSDARLPVIVNFQDPIFLGQGNAYSKEELNKIYKNFQPTGRELYDNLADKAFGSFADTLTYDSANHTLVNKSNSFDQFEKFICTREQYYVMADFIDYAIKNNLTFYIKSMRDDDINWKYVSDAAYNRVDHTITITYKDASDLDASSDDYTVTYVPAADDISSPVSDALKTIQALLALGPYSANTFEVLERLANSINVVDWQADKVLLRFSNEFLAALDVVADKSDKAGFLFEHMTSQDKLILYEKSRYKYNNDINCSYDDLKKGYELPVYKLTRKVYMASNETYETVGEFYVADINGRNTFYLVEKNDELKDENGNYIRDAYNDSYYTLVDSMFAGDEMQRVNANSVDPDDPNIINLGVIYGGSGNSNTQVDLGYVKVDPTRFFLDNIRTQYSGEMSEENEVTGEQVFGLYEDTLSKVVKKVSWPEKLFNDLQVIYSQVNINQMIATDKWLTQLSEYYEANRSNDFTSNLSTSLIHPLGLILSELFLANVDYSNNFSLYSNYTFSSKFDTQDAADPSVPSGEQTLDALFLSLMGESNYHQLKAEYEYFNEMFNAFMGPVLDEIAINEDLELFDGEKASPYLLTYKAYLASIMISDQATSWFYNMAIALIDNNDFADDILDPDTGYYREFSELADEFSKYSGGANSTIVLLYNANKELLKEQYVNEGDAAYPEYMTALKNYLYEYVNDGTIVSPFDGRLDCTLQSWLSDSLRRKQAVEAYKAYYNAYKAFDDEISSVNVTDLDQTDIRNLFTAPTVTAQNADNMDFTASYTDSTIAAEREKNGALLSSLTTMLEGSTHLSNSLEESLIDRANEFIDAASNFFTALENFLAQDMSYQHNGQLSSLKQQLKDYRTSIVNLQKQMDELDGVSEFLSENDLAMMEDVSSHENLTSSFNTPEGFNSFKNDVYNYYYRAMALKDDDATDEQKEIFNLVSQYYGTLKSYVETQQTIDRLNRYYIVYGVQSIHREDKNLVLNVVVNNKRYTVAQNFTEAKFVEYVLGANFLREKGISTVFVDDEYDGLIKITKDSSSSNGVRVSGFNTLQQFLVELGDMTANLYQMTNLINLTDNSVDEIVIGEGGQNDLAELILYTIVSQKIMDPDSLMSLFDVQGDDVASAIADLLQEGSSATADELTNEAKYKEIISRIQNNTIAQNNSILDTLFARLLGREANYSKMTLKQLRSACVTYLANYTEPKGVGSQQKISDFMAVFNMVSADWAEKNSQGTLGPVNNCWMEERRESINAIRFDKQTQAAIMRLAGLENRPYSDLVESEYTIDFNREGVDEKYGDIFVICTYDDEINQFIPFMMSNTRGASDKNLPKDETGSTWLQKYNFRNPYTEYYEGADESFYPVIAKGVIGESGRPTAIRQNGDNIEFYRDDVIIHNTSEIGLSMYYVNTDQLQQHHTFISTVVNTFSKLFTGKTLVEHVASAVPRFAAHSDLNLCYGTTTNVIDVMEGGKNETSVNFVESAGVKMSSLYTLRNMNILVLIIGVYTMIYAVWKALWGVTGRMFDITVLFLLGPAVISTINLRKDSRDSDDKTVINESNNDMYSSWKNTLTDRLLNVFAYAVGFNVFFLVVPIISEMTLFTTNSAFAGLAMFRHIPVTFLNEVARLIFIIAAAYLSTWAPALFSKISGFSNGFDYGNTVFGNVKSTVNAVGDVISGQYALDAVATAVDSAKDMIPGVAIAREIKDKVSAFATKVVAKGLEMYATAHGVPPDVAKNLSQSLVKKVEDRKAADRKRKAEERKAREARNNERWGIKDD